MRRLFAVSLLVLSISSAVFSQTYFSFGVKKPENIYATSAYPTLTNTLNNYWVQIFEKSFGLNEEVYFNTSNEISSGTFNINSNKDSQGNYVIRLYVGFNPYSQYPTFSTNYILNPELFIDNVSIPFKSIILVENALDTYSAFDITFCPAAPAYSYTTFLAPLDKQIKVNKNRCVPVKFNMYKDGVEIIDGTPPVLNIIFYGASALSGEPYTGTSPGNSSSGNTFTYVDGAWQYNLLISKEMGEGTYKLSAVSGNESEYSLIGTTGVIETVK